MHIDKKNLARLSPEERIKKLRLMEESKKKEVNEIGQLIKDSMQELRTDKLAEEIAPEQKAVDISRLFEATGEEKLERTARKESLLDSARGGGGYQAFTQVYQDYAKLKSMISYAVIGALSPEQHELVDAIGERLDKTKYETASSEIANLVVASRATLHKIKRYMGM